MGYLVNSFCLRFEILGLLSSIVSMRTTLLHLYQYYPVEYGESYKNCISIGSVSHIMIIYTQYMLKQLLQK